MDDELNVDSEEIYEHEFAVFADLEFDLYIPRREFMPHFEQIFNHLGKTPFFSHFSLSLYGVCISHLCASRKQNDGGLLGRHPFL